MEPLTDTPFNHDFRSPSRPDVRGPLFLRFISCKHCHLIFAVCRSCYRGQTYCCQSCRIEAQRTLHRQAQRRYRLTKKGREAHRLAEKRRRMRKSFKNTKTVDDASTTPTQFNGSLSLKGLFPVAHCHFCGCTGIIVKEFPHRGYGKPRHPKPKITSRP